MREFVHYIKLYGFPAERRVSLSFRATARFVQTFHITEEIFDRILAQCETREGCNLQPFFVHAKGDYVRFSHSANSLETNWRIPMASWRALVEDYARQRRECGGKGLITCLIE